MSSLAFTAYPRPRDRYDEMYAADGEARPHWRRLAEALAHTSPAQWRERGDLAQQHIRENGITYNVYADPKGADRPWPLDIVPLLLPAEEWAQLSAAVAQRATLLDRVLADLYGEQTLLADKSLPPALVYGHNGYLWPCRGIRPPGDRWLHVYAVDLARSPDGRWWVIADRTQGPSGAGYALENRQIVSRLYPSLYRELNVQHIGAWFRTLQQSLLALAPVEPGETPTMVLLTPGPLNETYFEHVYLARQFGFTLAEGQDLTVRGDTLYLKTVGGLTRVHALLRRQDDDFCDPLDLRMESTLGVPGLVSAARAGRVLVANALGSGVLESAGVTGFLPALCERLLGEKLRLPSVATWWCGEAAARAYVEANLESLVLKPAYPSQRMEAVFGDRLDAAERAHWIERIRARPNAYVAQELVRLSQAPTLANDLTTGALSTGDAPQLQPRTIGMRVYAVADGNGGYEVLPGGLARVAGDTSIDVLSMQRGGGSKDIWVLGDGTPTAARSTPPAGPERGVQRQPAVLASRAAENLFWLGRYAERVDGHARLLRVALTHLLEDGAGSSLPLALCARTGLTGGARPDPARPDAGLIAAMLDGNRPGSLVANIQRAGRAAMHARERLSVDHWQAIERLQDVTRRSHRARPRVDVALALLDRVLLAGTALVGHAMDDMVRDAGWRFLVIGRAIERCQFLTLLVQEALAHGDGDAAAIECLLETADSVDTWRQRYLRAPSLVSALDIVVFDDNNPHALAFQLGKLCSRLARLQRECGGDAFDQGELAALLTGLRALEPAVQEGTLADAALAERLAGIWLGTAALSNRLGERFFSHVSSTQPRWQAVWS